MGIIKLAHIRLFASLSLMLVMGLPIYAFMCLYCAVAIGGGAVLDMAKKK